MLERTTDTTPANEISGERPRVEVGILLAAPWVEELDSARHDAIDCLEILAEGYLGDQSTSSVLSRLAQRWPVIVHGQSLSVGGPDPLDGEYLSGLQRLAKSVGALFLSDHAGLARACGVWFGNVFPLPFTEEAAWWMARRAREAAERVGFPLALENVWCPAAMPGSVLSEGEFIGLVLERSGAGLVLDLDTLHENAVARGLDADALLRDFPLHRLWQLRLGARRDARGAIFDAVWKLYRSATAIAGPRPTVIEQTSPVPPLARILSDVAQARGTQRAEASARERPVRMPRHDLAC